MALISSYDSDDFLVLDFETTAHRNGLALYPENRLLLSCWAVGPEGKMNVLWGNEYEADSLVKAIKKAPFIVAHNAKFELQWLERCGLDIGEILVWDTMIAEHVLNGNRTGPLSLDALAAKHLKSRKKITVSALIGLGIPVENIPAMWLQDYCARDVELTRQLFLRQRREVSEAELSHIQYARCRLTPVLAQIETRGLQLDPERVAPELTQKELDYAALGSELVMMMGADVNVRSPIQLAEFLYDRLGFAETVKRVNREWIADRTATGRRKTDADTIQSLNVRTEEQRRFLDLYTRHRELHNELTKYLRKFGECCGAGGLLKAQFNQCRTQTHRLSSTGLEYSTQLQNLPRSYKRLFRARTPGWLVGEADGAQLEFRVAAHLGRDRQAIEDIVNGVDVHKVTAGILGVSRQDAKPYTFKPLYGGSSGTTAQKEYFAYFKDRYKGIAEAQTSWINQVLETKRLRTEYGLIFYWPNTEMQRSGYITNTTSICNFPVQGFATAEIIPLALIEMNRLIKERGLRMFIVNTVHDSIIVELPPDEVEAFHEIAREALIPCTYKAVKEVYGIDLIVPLGCGIKVGEHWGDGEEVKYEAERGLYE